MIQLKNNLALIFEILLLALSLVFRFLFLLLRKDDVSKGAKHLSTLQISISLLGVLGPQDYSLEK